MPSKVSCCNMVKNILLIHLHTIRWLNCMVLSDYLVVYVKMGKGTGEAEGKLLIKAATAAKIVCLCCSCSTSEWPFPPSDCIRLALSLNSTSTAFSTYSGYVRTCSIQQTSSNNSNYLLLTTHWKRSVHKNLAWWIKNKHNLFKSWL